MKIEYAPVLLVAALVVIARPAKGAQAQPDQHVIAQQLLVQNVRERNSAFEAAGAFFVIGRNSLMSQAIDSNSFHNPTAGGHEETADETAMAIQSIW